MAGAQALTPSQRASNFVRQYLQMAFAMLVPQQFALGRAHKAFGADGAPTDTRAAQSVERVAGALRGSSFGLLSKI